MPTTAQLRSRLISKLKELFQLDQPDLDFGFYRIMHAKAEQVERFIDNDLLKIVDQAFTGSGKEKTESELGAAKRKLVEAMGEDALQADGSVNPAFANTPAGKAYTEAVAKAGSQVASLSDEGQVYDHLFRFFERYYDNGDFVSRRYYTRETDGRAAPFAIPYNGEEVKLHWANADQYYIKTAEYFNHYSFDLAQAAEFRGLNDIERRGSGVPDKPVMVHFKIVDASEGEHGNVKAKDDDKRFFIIHQDEPIAFDENGELVVNFEYRADPDKGSKQEGSWRDQRNAEAVEVILEALEAIKDDNATAATCLQLFKAAAPTEKDKKRPLLAKYLNQYTARNTMDYFIHKNLGGFLRRELDFYIKNEVMRLDDLDQADAPAVEGYLSKLKVLRKIAHKLIDFLAQLEDFQKKLWLKKKFVVETNYCITLDRVPEALYAEIAANDAQREEWIKLFAIDEIEATEGDLVSQGSPGYSEPLTIDFLKANDKLVLDTKFFDADFKAHLLEAIEDFDAQCDGLLVHSENFQAINSVSESYLKQIKCIYIDPPFNLGQNGDYLYRTDYKDSTWATLLQNRVLTSTKIFSEDGIFYLRCDHNGNYISRSIIEGVFGKDGFQYELSVQRIRKNVTGQGKISLPLANDSLFMAFNSENSELADPYLKLEKTREAYWRRIDDSAGYRNPPERIIFGKTFFPYKRDAHFKYSQKSIDSMVKEGRIKLTCKNRSCDYEHTEGDWTTCPKCGSKEATPKYLVNSSDTKILDTNWMDVSGYSSSTGFSTENAEPLLRRAIEVATFKGELVADYFAGSGTTLAVAQKTGRRWLGVEIADQINIYIIPRLKQNCLENSISHCFKYIRLESYEDTLNNLTFDEDTKRTDTIERSPALKEDYMLRYLLDVETRGSQSLLNIDAFADPTAYQLTVKKSGSDEQETRQVDLIETFNYLIGLRVTHYAAPQTFTASFKREPDPELPEDQHTKLIVDGAIKQDADGPWWFRKVEGWVPKNPSVPDHETRDKNPQNMERILIVWRKLTGDLEEDNLMLDVWFRKHGINTQDYEYDTIYVNGSNNLPNLKQDDEHWKVRLTEEEFMKRMWDTSDA